jgi:hypothetical protein
MPSVVIENPVISSPLEEPHRNFCEVTGAKTKDKQTKVAAARNLWVPAVNNHGGFGRWLFLEITDPWDAMGAMRRFLNGPHCQV